MLYTYKTSIIYVKVTWITDIT